ncbi:MAG: hypothetical protein SPI12_03780 [Actinomycetaceae bacterium]|nr:hypothetical protein [Actinomycetaceae bacterium]MDY6082964.1 hypothetical protein [Actinomycetaceae bacterium]
MALLIVVIVLIAVAVLLSVFYEHHDVGEWVSDSMKAWKDEELEPQQFDVQVNVARVDDVFASFPTSDDQETPDDLLDEWFSLPNAVKVAAFKRAQESEQGKSDKDTVEDAGQPDVSSDHSPRAAGRGSVQGERKTKAGVGHARFPRPQHTPYPHVRPGVVVA